MKGKLETTQMLFYSRGYNKCYEYATKENRNEKKNSTQNQKMGR